MPIGLFTPTLTDYRIPLYERLAARFDVEVVLFGRGDRYVPAWSADLDAQLASAPFPARRLTAGARDAFALAGRYAATIAPFAGGTILPAAYAGTRVPGRRRPFLLWATVWAQPRSAVHTATLPVLHRIYRDADAVITYGEHVSAFVDSIRGAGRGGVFVAPQSVEAELFGRTVAQTEIAAFRDDHDIPPGPIVLYVGRLVPEKGLHVLLHAWATAASRHDATLVLAGDGPLADDAARAPRTRLLGATHRAALPVAYAASAFAVLPSVPTPRFREPWGLVCNEAMHQGRTVIATDAVGAAAGGLVRDGETGLVVPASDAVALGTAIERLLTDDALRHRLEQAARTTVAGYTYDAMADAFGRALGHAGAR